MAIVINHETGNTASVNNEMLFTVYEATKAIDPTTFPDYSYVCDVYVNSVMVERLIARPDPTYKRGIFDVSRALQPYATYGLNASAASVDYAPRIAYQLKFGEQYDGTLYTNLTVDSSDRYCFGTYRPKPFTSTGVLTGSMIASNMPDVVYSDRNGLWHLIPFFGNATGVNDLIHQLRSENGTILQNTTLSNSGISASGIRQFNVGSNAITNTSGKYATIAYPTASDIIKTIRYIDDCRFSPRTLVWLNPFGAYDSQTFGLVSKKSIELTKKDFTQLDYRLNASGVVSYRENNVFYGGKRGFNTNVKTRLSLTSHLLTDEEYTWLGELFISPDVYLHIDGAENYDDPGVPSSYFMPVTVVQSNYDYRSFANSRLTPLQFEIEYSNIYNSQLL